MSGTRSRRSLAALLLAVLQACAHGTQAPGAAAEGAAGSAIREG